MYSFTNYPALSPHRDYSDITFDIIECSEEAFDSVTRMEFNAGYERKTINIEGTDYKIFSIKIHEDATYDKVEEGDWLKYKGLLA